MSFNEPWKGNTVSPTKQIEVKTSVCDFCGSPVRAAKWGHVVCPSCGRDDLGYGPKMRVSDGIRVGFGALVVLPVIILVILILIPLLGGLRL